jgi:hypothetical protein
MLIHYAVSSTAFILIEQYRLVNSHRYSDAGEGGSLCG